MVSVIILAGGKSSRMGKDKLRLSVGTETFLEAAVRKFSAEFENVYLSVPNEEKYVGLNCRFICDVFPGLGPLSGLHAALADCHGDGVFLVAADMPFSDPNAAREIIRLGAGYDACAIKNGDKTEPLFTYYSKNCLAACERAIDSGFYKMETVLNAVSVRYIRPAELGELWKPELVFNVNYPKDYDSVRKILDMS